MTDPAPYQGKRLSAKEVLRLYTGGERNFRGAILRGCNFRGADLSEVDFTRADICSAKFVDATLQKANFSHAKAGLQRRWVATQLLLIVVIAALAGFLQGYMGTLLGVSLIDIGSLSDLILAATSCVAIVVVFSAIAQLGFTLRAFGSVAVAVALTVVVALAGAVPSAFAFSGAFAVAVSAAVAIVGAFAVAFAFADTFTFFVSVTVAVVFAFAGASTVAFTVDVALSVASTVASLLLWLCIADRIGEGDPKFENLRVIGLTFAALGGTTFSGADLTGAYLSHAVLKSTNFAHSRQRLTELTHVRWHNVEKLDHARLGISNLQNSSVRNLLTTLNGVDQDLYYANLEGANLAGAKLHHCNLEGADLSDAILEDAELYGANLTEANCIGTDFTAAHLTGACLEAWNIDSTTILKDIDCDYVYLLEHPDAKGSRERRPHDPDKIFQPGDFEKFFREMFNTVQILIRNGVDPQAFRTALEKVMTEYPLVTRDSIQAMEKHGSDVRVTLQVPEGTDKGKLERIWDEGYQLGLKEGYTSGLLEGQKQRADDVKEVALGFSRFFPPIHINNMNNPINTGDGSVYAGGDLNLSGSTLNLGEISGQVSNQINQIPDAPADQPSLRDLLAQLKTAIDADTELDDQEKAEALQAVSRLAAVGAEPDASEKKLGIAKRATNALKGIAETLTNTSKLATACETLLPTIMGLLGL